MLSIVRWVAAGAPRGEGEEPAPPEIADVEWTLGPPDQILEIEPVEIPAEGPDQFVQRSDVGRRRRRRGRSSAERAVLRRAVQLISQLRVADSDHLPRPQHVAFD